MSLLLVFLSTIISFLSMAMMSYIAMAINVAPWVAPVVAVVVMVLLLKIIDREWFKTHVVISIAAGSVGGMVGLCIGLTWPSFYFSHQGSFSLWMLSPYKFAGMISMLVVAAGLLAFVVSYFLKHYLIVERNLTFPMSYLVYQIIYAEERMKSSFMILNGLVVSSSWNIFTWIARGPLTVYLNQLHTIPAFLSIGFVAGQAITVSLLVGMLSRIVALNFIKEPYFYFEKQQVFLLTFASGMLFAEIFASYAYFVKELYSGAGKKRQSRFFALIYRFLKDKYYAVISLSSLVIVSVVLSWWQINFAQQLYVLLASLLLGGVVSILLGEVGVLDVQSFVSFIVLPLTYFFYIESLSVLIVVVFVTLFLGIVIDLLFSYKIAQLAKVSYRKLLPYQILGFATAACSVGFILWWYINTFKLGSNNLLAQQALSQEAFITFANYNYQVLLVGFAFALALSLLVSDTLVVIGGFMMPVSMSFWLILAGGISYLVEDRKKLYPFCFGLYASHTLWMFVRALC